MLFEERIQKILSLIEKEGTVENSYLVKKINVSEATIRRDLDHLEKKGKIKRVRGGAILSQIEREEKSISDKTDIALDSKLKIAKIASRFIEDGDYIYLDAGTTTHQLIDYMKDKNIKVVTNGVMHLEKLAKYNIDTYLIGGFVKKKTLAIIGAKAARDLSEFSFDKAFMGMNGICDKNGFTTPDTEEAMIKRKAIEQSNKTFVLADETKFGRTYFSVVARLDEATIISDSLKIDKKFLKKVEIINK